MDKDVAGDYFSPFIAGLYKLGNLNDITSYSAKLDFLSPPVEKIIFDHSTAEFVEERVGTKFSLSRDQKEGITNLIREILLGEIFIGDFIKTTQTRLNIDEQKAKDIVSMIVAELFPPAVESIKRVQRLKFPAKVQELAQGKTSDAKPTPQLEVKPQSPTTLTQPTARPVEPRQSLTPAQQIKQAQEAIKPPQVPPLRPAPPQLPPRLEVRPPNIQQPPKPAELEVKPQPQRPENRPPSVDSIQAKQSPRPEVKPQKTPEVQPRRPEFKIPDLGPSFAEASAGKQPVTKENGSTKSAAEKSLETELEKVASIIDLRNRTKE